MRGACGAHSAWQVQYLVNLDVSKESRLVKLSSFSILDVLMIPCGRCSTSDTSGSIFDKKVAETDVSHRFDISMFSFRGERNVLCVSDRSCCSAMNILMSRVGSLWL